MRIALVLLVACHARVVEHRATMPTTELCAPHDYLLPQRHAYAQTDPFMWIREDGLQIGEGIATPRTPDWADGGGNMIERYDLEDGRWLILLRSNELPDDPALDGRDPFVAYIHDASSTTFAGRGYWMPEQTGAFFVVFRDGKMFYADVDRSTPTFRALGLYNGQTLLGISAGTAVLWTRAETQVTVSCLGGASHTFAVPAELDPAGADAVRDQRVLLQGPTSSKGREVSSPIYVLDLDRSRIRYIGTAGGGFEDAYTNVPRMIAVSRVAWSSSPVVVPIGNISKVNRVDPATEALGY